MFTQPVILAAVDLDSRAIQVIERAARLAALCHGRLVVAHLVDHRVPMEADLPFSQPQEEVRADMVRYARASLVGMLNSLDLPNTLSEVRIETGPVIEGIEALVSRLGPRYCVIGHPRLRPLGATVGLAAALHSRGDCELVEVPGNSTLDRRRPVGRARRWLAANLGVPAGQAH